MTTVRTVRRTFCDGNSLLSVSQGGLLHRFAGLAGSDEYNEEEDRDFDSSPGSFSIVAQVQRSKPGIRKGDSDGFQGSTTRVLEFNSRSRRAEQLYKKAHMVFEGPVKVRVMDIDEFRLDELHQYFMFTLVRRFPAERCVKVASRVALFRDKHSQHSFESMSKDVGKLFGPTHGAELTALFSRCYNTIPVAYMLDYIRRFGKFSRRYIAMQVDKTMNPRLFDFVRYPSGVRPLPGIVTRPFSLRSFAWMLPPCSAKRYLFQHLLAHTGDPKILERLEMEEKDVIKKLKSITSGSAIDPQANSTRRISEMISSGWKTNAHRPVKLLSDIESNAYSKQPSSAGEIIDLIEQSVTVPTKSLEYDPFSSQKTKIHPFQSPLSEETDALNTIQNGCYTNSVTTEWEEPDRPQDNWWKHRSTSTSFFRHNKKAYRLLPDEGWKQIPDPRGESPDYMRPKMLRNSKRRIAALYRRRANKQRRDFLTSNVIANLCS